MCGRSHVARYCFAFDVLDDWRYFFCDDQSQRTLRDIDMQPESSASSTRPLSPHLQVFRPLITMIMSIFHRITGGALYVGTLLVAWWLVAAASGPGYYEWVNGFFGSIVGRLILFAYTWTLVHHMLGGIRHLVWDTGLGLEKPYRDQIAWATLLGSVGLTLLIWGIGYAVR